MKKLEYKLTKASNYNMNIIDEYFNFIDSIVDFPQCENKTYYDNCDKIQECLQIFNFKKFYFKNNN